ncbi:unnamed protein product [Blumeria hordei]|uniref:Uncharacterized protein n=1 Tax=Blumeria hordei TaxID=2867405 RepID=A0A383UQZ1_BLUHO|nr:unnamed protein product [Blumeria hordei]
MLVSITRMVDNDACYYDHRGGVPLHLFPEATEISGDLL